MSRHPQPKSHTHAPATPASRPAIPRMMRLALLLSVAFCVFPGATATAQAQSAEARRSYDIPGGPLSQVLNAYASAAGVELSMDAALLQGRRSNGLSGTYSVREGFGELLRGQGLQALPESNGSYTLRPAPTSHHDTTTLEAVTVTAQSAETAAGPLHGYVARLSATGTRTDTPIIETPQSISVVGAEEIDTLKSQSIQDALGYVAGVSRAEGMDRTSDSLFLRGFRSNLGNYYRDGMLYTVNIYDGRQEVYGLERIEFLKGASSVLYGSASPGGIINTVSKRPTVEPLRELNVEAGNYSRRQISGDFGGALDEEGKWSYRLTALLRDSDTFVDHVPDDRTYIAPAITWQPSAATSLTLLAEYQKDHTVYVYGLPAQGTVLPNVNGRIPRNRFTGEPGFDKFNMERYSIGYLFEHAFNSQLKLRNSARYFHADSTYHSTDIWQLAPDQRWTADRGAMPRWDRSSALISDTSLQYEAGSSMVRHTLLAGIDYSLPKHETERYIRSNNNIDLYDPVYGLPLGPAAPFPGSSSVTDMKRLGIYLQDQIKIADKWVVLLGGRQDWVTVDERNFFTDEKYADGEKSKAFTGRAGLVYLADNGLAPFLSYSESFEPTSGQDRQGSRFQPTTGQQYEAGLRYQPTGSDTMLSAAVYQLTRKNMTVTDPLDTSYQIQAGEARTRGLELEARTRIGRNANLIAAYAYTDARTLKASPLQPDEEGKRLNSVPYNQFSLWGDYGFGDFGLPGLRIGAGLRYVGSTRGIAHGMPVEVPSFTLFDAMISYATGPWKFALNASNLTDKTYIGSCTYGCFYGEPRRVIGTATYRW
ncbi:Ferrichrome outer membrane transporter/phage receptor [Achromobacter anxifer]|uniref:TonB-dependent siderophore receptor n=1 Tax=Achromobacter anxifer TaxID=1287737 RepID=UPI00155C2210|nr:TonB-dependent siderophore receptor [Achromobacter anxifer]CAB5511031.1 Ferrichrome outer membrane transporter/phage receptor [Achromobacter anxifer]